MLQDVEIQSGNFVSPISPFYFDQEKLVLPFENNTSESDLRIIKRLLSYSRSQVVEELKEIKGVEKIPLHLQSRMYNNVERAMTAVDMAHARSVFYRAFIFEQDELILVDGFGKTIRYKNTWNLKTGISKTLRLHLKEMLARFKNIPFIAVGKTTNIQWLINDEELCSIFDHKLCIGDDEKSVDYYSLLKKFSEEIINDSDYEAVKSIQEARAGQILYGLSQVSAWISDEHSNHLILDESYYTSDSNNSQAMIEAVNELVATAFYFGIKIHFLPRGLLPKEKRLCLVLEKN